MKSLLNWQVPPIQHPSPLLLASVVLVCAQTVDWHNLADAQSSPARSPGSTLKEAE